jgi:hypothetical protein
MYSQLAACSGKMPTCLNDVKDKLNADLVVSGSASNVKTFLSLQNVTNESKATMFTDAALTGTPTAPTAVANTNSTQIATTAYVQQELTDLIGGASAAFDTLIEISASLASGDSTLNTLVDGKLSKEQRKAITEMIDKQIEALDDKE